MRCECCAAPLALPGLRPRTCPRCKGVYYAKKLAQKTLEMEVIEANRTGAASFGLEHLELLAAKTLDPADLLAVELFRCPLCGHGIVLGAVAEPVREGQGFRLRLPVKRTMEMRCVYCGRPNRALMPAEEPLEVSVVPVKKDSFEYQVDQFLRQPPPPASPERPGCLGLLLFFLVHR